MKCISSKSDRDRARNSGGRNSRTVADLRRIIHDYDQGRGATSCMDELKRLIGPTQREPRND